MAQSSKARVVVAPTGTVHVHVPPDVLFDLPAVQQLSQSILGRLGCPACCSGFQILFQLEESEWTI
jgi:hypothetical protein